MIIDYSKNEYPFESISFVNKFVALQLPQLQTPENRLKTIFYN